LAAEISEKRKYRASITKQGKIITKETREEVIEDVGAEVEEDTTTTITIAIIIILMAIMFPTTIEAIIDLNMTSNHKEEIIAAIITSITITREEIENREETDTREKMTISVGFTVIITTITRIEIIIERINSIKMNRKLLLNSLKYRNK
jgi:uncharacterized membrane protein